VTAAPKKKKAEKKKVTAAPKKKKAEKKCEKQNEPKYLHRDSPPFPANACPLGQIKEGNDGEMWITKANKNGVKRWVRHSN
jgi:hypothetical protein